MDEHLEGNADATAVAATAATEAGTSALTAMAKVVMEEATSTAVARSSKQLTPQTCVAGNGATIRQPAA